MVCPFGPKYPVDEAALSTRRRTSSVTFLWLLNTRDTVPIETLASWATSFTVTEFTKSFSLPCSKAITILLWYCYLFIKKITDQTYLVNDFSSSNYALKRRPSSFIDILARK